MQTVQILLVLNYESFDRENYSYIILFNDSFTAYVPVTDAHMKALLFNIKTNEARHMW